MESQEAFERNLARLRQSEPELAAALEATDPDGAEVVVGPRGAHTVSSEGVLLASAYDPEGEGERMAESMDQEPSDLLVAIGFGLGHHLEAYRRRHPCPIVVFEPSLARLRAALSARPIPWLGAADVHLVHDTRGLSKCVHSLYATGLSIKTYPHPSSLRLSPGAVREAVSCIAQAKRAIDVNTMTSVHRIAPWAELTIDNAPHLLRTPSFSRLFEAFSGVPAVVAAAGPSLDRQLPVLARYADRVLVIAIGQSLRALRRAGIEPHLTHAVESQDVSRQLTDAGDPSGLAAVLLPSVHPALFSVPVGRRFVAYPAPNPIACWIAEGLGDTSFFLGGATVAQSAVHLAAAAGASPILLIGQDLAYTGGRVYAANSAYDFMGLRHTAEGEYVLTDAAEKHRMLGNEPSQRDTEARELVWVEGWDGEPVATSIAYASFIENYREIGDGLQSLGVRLVNCTEGGARIHGLEHRGFEEMLGECAGEPVAAREIVEAAAAPEPVPPEHYAEPLRRARGALTRLERDARAGLGRVGSAGRALGSARRPQRKIQILEGVVDCERRVRQSLENVPWLDTFVQPAILRSLARLRKARPEAPSPQEVVEESRVLFQAVVDGIDRARELLDRFEIRIAAGSGEGEPPDAPGAHAAAGPTP